MPSAAHPNYRHGERSYETAKLRKLVNALGRESRNVVDSMK